MDSSHKHDSQAGQLSAFPPAFPRFPRKRFVGMRQARFGLGLLSFLFSLASVSAATVTLVSTDSVGNPGNQDSGVISTYIRPATVLDDGSVFFLTLSQLTLLDTNAFVDYYRCLGNDKTVVDYQAENLNSNNIIFWAGMTFDGSTTYFFRFFFFPRFSDLKYGPWDAPALVGQKNDVINATLAGSGTAAVYEQTSASSGTSHLIYHHLSPDPKTETDITAAAPFAAASNRTPAISADGGKVAFSSMAQGAGDSNAVEDIYLYTRAAGSFSLVSQRLNLGGTLLAAVTPAISGDGQVIAFASADSNFVLGDTNKPDETDVFTWESGVIRRCNLSAGGVEANKGAETPKLNRTGRFVVYISQATNLLSVQGNTGTFKQIYLYDRTTGGVECLSTDASGNAADADCLAPEISPNGQYVTFISKATNLAANLTGNTFFQVFLADRGPDFDAVPTPAAIQCLTAKADADSGSSQSNLSFMKISLSGDGSKTVFSSLANTLSIMTFIPFAYNYTSNVYEYSDASHSVSVLTDKLVQSQHHGYCVISANSLYTAFFSYEGNHIIRKDLVTGAMITVDTLSIDNPGSLSISSDGQQIVSIKNSHVYHYNTSTGNSLPVETGNQAAAQPAISADGKIVVFTSSASDLVPGANPANATLAFWRELDTGTTRIASRQSDGITLIGNAQKPTVSKNGKFVLFRGGPNSDTIYRKNMLTGEFRTLMENASNPTLSADGRYAYYTKTGNNLKSQAYRLDLAASAGTAAELVSQSLDRGEGNDSSSLGALSADGRYAAFASKATNLVEPTVTNGLYNVFRRDFNAPAFVRPTPVLTVSNRVVRLQSNASVAIPMETVVISDGDYPAGEHPEKLIVLFQTAPQYGTLNDSNGQAVSGQVAYSLFPLTYIPAQPGEFHVEKITISVVDADDPDGIASGTQTLEIVSGAVTCSVSLQSGWNYLAFPLDPYPFDANPAEFFQKKDGSIIISIITGAVWEWDAVNRRFIPATALAGGQGCMVFAKNAAEIPEIIGRPRTNGQITVTPGWNLAGPSGTGSRADVPAEIAGRIWGWDPLRRILLPVATEAGLNSGQAYWFNVPANTTSLNLSLHP